MLQQLKQLTEVMHLQGMAACVEEVLSKAQQQGSAIQEVILALLEAEYQSRQTKSLNNRLKNAKMPMPWTLDTFPFKRQPGVSKTQVMSLAKLDFIRHNENIIFIGKPGTGKSGLAMSLLRLALINGYRGRFYNAQDLLNELYASLADRTTSRLLKTLTNYDILIIDLC